MSDCYLGSVVLWAGKFVPRNWMLCNGALLNINGNEALYALIGTTYGGNGTTDFALPNLIGRFPIGVSPTIPLTAIGGNLTSATTGTATLTADNLPAHSHPDSGISLTGLTAITTVKLSTDANKGQVIPTENALLSGTTSGSQQAAAIYLPATTAQLVPVSLGGVTTTLSATTAVAVSDAVTGNTAGVTPVVINGAVTALPATLTLNYLICVSGEFPSRP